MQLFQFEPSSCEHVFRVADPSPANSHLPGLLESMGPLFRDTARFGHYPSQAPLWFVAQLGRTPGKDLENTNHGYTQLLGSAFNQIGRPLSKTRFEILPGSDEHYGLTDPPRLQVKQSIYRGAGGPTMQIDASAVLSKESNQPVWDVTIPAVTGTTNIREYSVLHDIAAAWTTLAQDVLTHLRLSGNPMFKCRLIPKD